MKTERGFRAWHGPVGASVVLTFIVAIVVFATGCGSSAKTPPPAMAGNTSVTLLLSSTANDQVSQFDIDFNSLTLTNKAGKTVNVFTTGQNPEFIHLNGKVEPLLTVDVPQDVYTSATATIGGSLFTCVAEDVPDNTLVVAEYSYGSTPSSQVTVNLPAPLTIAGKTMGLTLDMQVLPSASFPSSCFASGLPPFSINPAFNLTQSALAFPINEPMLAGEISAVNAADSSFTVTLAAGQAMPPDFANGPQWTVKATGSTVYQGLNSFSSLTVGTFVEMDAALQSDGSQLATRIAVEDADNTNLSVTTGPLLSAGAIQPYLYVFGRQNQGSLWNAGRAGNIMPFGSSSAVFQISRRFTNLGSLPFNASFDATNMFGGQNVSVSSHATIPQPAPTYFPATTVTLIPQTINGAINSISSDGGFTTYGVTLTSYDLIPNLTTAPGVVNVLTNPSNVVVYVDGSTRLANSQPLAVGNVVRFNGLLFNDGGTLRMDCGQVNDGVALLPNPAAVAVRSSVHQGKVSIHTLKLQ